MSRQDATMEAPLEEWPFVDPTAASPLGAHPMAGHSPLGADASHGASRDLVGGAPSLVFRDRARFTWKAALLLVTTLGFVPILLWRHEWAAIAYIAALIVVHVAGLLVFLWGIRKQDIAPTRRGLLVRLAGLATVFVLLSFAAGGLDAGIESLVFWASLAAIWALHTGGLLLMHVRTRGEALACPFL